MARGEITVISLTECSIVATAQGIVYALFLVTANWRNRIAFGKWSFELLGELGELGLRIDRSEEKNYNQARFLQTFKQKP